MRAVLVASVVLAVGAPAALAQQDAAKPDRSAHAA